MATPLCITAAASLVCYMGRQEGPGRRSTLKGIRCLSVLVPRCVSFSSSTNRIWQNNCRAAQRVSNVLQPGNPNITTDSISSSGRDVLIFMIVKPVGHLHSRINFLFKGCSSSVHQSPLSAGET